MPHNKKISLRTAPLLLSFILTLLAAFPAAARAQAGTPQDLAYLALVDKAVQDPEHGDWCRIRDMYADTSF
jgi:hypothetical protein